MSDPDEDIYKAEKKISEFNQPVRMTLFATATPRGKGINMWQYIW